MVGNFFLITLFLIASSVAEVKYKEIHVFNGTDGGGPLGKLLLSTDNKLYGSTAGGGEHGCGTLFTIDGDRHTLIHHFNCSHGQAPFAELVEVAPGTFYGTTQNGGLFNKGTLFKFNATHPLEVLHDFNGKDGSVPTYLVKVSDNKLYGVTVTGGDHNAGTIYTIDLNGGVQSIYHFHPLFNGAYPMGLVAFETEVYVLSQLGPNTLGAIYEIDQNDTVTLLYEFNPNNPPTVGFPNGLTFVNTSTEPHLFGTGIYAYPPPNYSLQCCGLFSANSTVMHPPAKNSPPLIALLKTISLSASLGGFTYDGDVFLYGVSPSSYETAFEKGGIYRFKAEGKTERTLEPLFYFDSDPTIVGKYPKVPPTQQEPGVFYGVTYGTDNTVSPKPGDAGVVYKLIV